MPYAPSLSPIYLIFSSRDAHLLLIFQFKSEVIKELQAELAAEMAARGETGPTSLPSAQPHHVASRIGPIVVPEPRASTHSGATPKVHTFASVQQAPAVPRKVQRSTSASSQPSRERSPPPAVVLPPPRDPIVFPADVMSNESRRKVLSLLLKAVRSHLEDRLAAHSTKAHKRSRDDGAELVPEPLNANAITDIAIGVEAAIFARDTTCGEVQAWNKLCTLFAQW